MGQQLHANVDAIAPKSGPFASDSKRTVSTLEQKHEPGSQQRPANSEDSSVSCPGMFKPAKDLAPGRDLNTDDRELDSEGAHASHRHLDTSMSSASRVADTSPQPQGREGKTGLSEAAVLPESLPSERGAGFLGSGMSGEKLNSASERVGTQSIEEQEKSRDMLQERKNAAARDVKHYLDNW